MGCFYKERKAKRVIDGQPIFWKKCVPNKNSNSSYAMMAQASPVTQFTVVEAPPSVDYDFQVSLSLMQ